MVTLSDEFEKPLRDISESKAISFALSESLQDYLDRIEKKLCVADSPDRAWDYE